MQRKWIAAVLAGRLLLTRRRMRHAMERPERRTRQPFQAEGPHDIRCDPHAYRASEFIGDAPVAAQVRAWPSSPRREW